VAGFGRLRQAPDPHEKANRSGFALGPAEALLADKGYDSDAIRSDLRARGIRPVIPPRSNRKTPIRWNKRLYRLRNRIEQMFGHLKINRAIATRYDKLAESFLRMLHLAAIRYWIKFVPGA